MRLRLWIAALALVTFPSLPAHAAWLTKGPYLVDPRPDSVTVMWETSEALPGELHLVDRAGGRERVLEAGSVGTLHAVVVTGLAPGRRYPYYVVSGSLRSELGSLSATPRPWEPFTFIVFGDNRNGNADHRAVVRRFVQDAPDLVINTGDLTDKGTAGEWQEFFAIEHDALRDAPVAATMGNHDADGLRKGNPGFRYYFPPPGGAPAADLYYAFTFGNSRFVVLDTNTYLFALSDETSWLEDELRAARANPAVRHIFVFMHHPALSSSSHGGLAGIRDSWGPLFQRYQVDDVFAGHDHAYERCEENGIRYLVTGGGGAPLYGERNPADEEDRTALVTFEKVHHYVRVRVEGDFVSVTAIREDGSVIETLQQGRPPAGTCRFAHDCDGLPHAGCDGAWRCGDEGCVFACGAEPDPFATTLNATPATSVGTGVASTTRRTPRALVLVLPVLLGAAAVGWALRRGR